MGSKYADRVHRAARATAPAEMPTRALPQPAAPAAKLFPETCPQLERVAPRRTIEFAAVWPCADATPDRGVLPVRGGAPRCRHRQQKPPIFGQFCFIYYRARSVARLA